LCIPEIHGRNVQDGQVYGRRTSRRKKYAPAFEPLTTAQRTKITRYVFPMAAISVYLCCRGPGNEIIGTGGELSTAAMVQKLYLADQPFLSRPAPPIQQLAVSAERSLADYRDSRCPWDTERFRRNI